MVKTKSCSSCLSQSFEAPLKILTTEIINWRDFFCLITIDLIWNYQYIGVGLAIHFKLTEPMDCLLALNPV